MRIPPISKQLAVNVYTILNTITLQSVLHYTVCSDRNYDDIPVGGDPGCSGSATSICQCHYLHLQRKNMFCKYVLILELL